MQQQEKEIQELKERLVNVEEKLQRKSNFSNALKFVLGFILIFVVLMIAIGVFQFISSNSS
jgi:cytochrome c biogenesis protein CcdA